VDFQLTEAQRMLKQNIGEVAEKEFKPKANEWEISGKFPSEEVMKRLAELGFLGIPLPVEYGGQGRSNLDCILAVEEFARVSLLATWPVFEAGVGPIKAIEHFGTEEQKRKYLTAASRGEMEIAIGVTEPESGSAATDMTTQAILDGDRYVVNGVKHFIITGGKAGAYVVWLRFGEEKGARGIGGLIVDSGSPGLSFGKQERLMGLNGVDMHDLIFNNCQVPRENLLVEQGGFGKLMSALDLQRCGNAAVSLGIAQAALDEAMKYSQQRKQFGKDICEFQAIQFLLADMLMNLEAARLLVYRAVANGGEGFPSRLEASMAKCFANDMVVEVAGAAFKVHGAYGYSKDYPVERLLRDSWAWGVAAGTTQMQRVTIASVMLRRRFDQSR